MSSFLFILRMHLEVEGGLVEFFCPACFFSCRVQGGSSPFSDLSKSTFQNLPIYCLPLLLPTFPTPTPFFWRLLCPLPSQRLSFVINSHLLTIFFLIEAKFAQHKIMHFKVYSSEVFSAFTILCNHHLYLVPNVFLKFSLIF